MPRGLGPRFVVEAGFLILLAVGTGIADLAPRTIVIVMGGAWLLVALLEWLAWRDRRHAGDPYAWRVPRPEPPYAQRPEPPYAQRPAEPEPLTSIVPPAAQPRRRRLTLRRRPAAGEETEA